MNNNTLERGNANRSSLNYANALRTEVKTTINLSSLPFIDANQRRNDSCSTRSYYTPDKRLLDELRELETNALAEVKERALKIIDDHAKTLETEFANL